MHCGFMRFLSECMRKGKHNHLFADIKIADEINQDQKEREREKKNFFIIACELATAGWAGRFGPTSPKFEKFLEQI